MDDLGLILTYHLLIKLVWSLKVVARQEQIQMESVFRVRTVIDAIEKIAGSAPIMKHGEFRCIEKATRALEGRRKKVSELCVAIPKGNFLADSAEGSVSRAKSAGRFSLIQTRFRNRIHHQAGLISEFSRCRARDHFQRLNRSGRQLR